MAKYKRITKKMDIKSPDEFLTFWDHTFHYVSDNREKLALPMIGVLVAVMLGFGFWYYQSQKMVRANNELYRVLAELPRQGSGLTVTPSPEIIDKLKAYDAQYGSTESGRIGRLYRANFLYQKGNFDEALPLYQGIGGNDAVGQLATINLSATQTQLGKFADAAGTLEKIRATTIFGEEVDYQIARNEEAAGNKGAAKTEYQKYLDKHPGAFRTAEVRTRLASL